MREYHFQLEKFQGPLDLLLKLIEDKRLEITDISLAQITAQYLVYIQTHKVNPESISGFLVVAAKLLLIKSREILPDLVLEKEEEEEGLDLKERLLRYQKYKLLALKLKELEKRGEYSLGREISFSRKVCFSPPKEIKVDYLEKAYLRVLAEIGSPEEMLEKRTLTQSISLAEKISLIQRIIRVRMKAHFSKLTSEGDRLGRILTFWAVLELFRRGFVIVEQRRPFGEILIKNR